ncbi:hypothetical protein ED733_004727 [Metarhizium rileyi]|uniref:Uncharacterized protein n=1 Tax=Metarhizium rileyi (strain RCEF 4871) TaxID=1649241 RepID=A0A5C6G5M2_METRR|nr:hypothetical protein ED733_004727 [Metarhizium rileyi]
MIPTTRPRPRVRLINALIRHIPWLLICLAIISLVQPWPSGQIAALCALTTAHEFPLFSSIAKVIGIASSVMCAVLFNMGFYPPLNERDASMSILCVLSKLLGCDPDDSHEACDRIRPVPWLVACIVHSQMLEKEPGFLPIYLAGWAYSGGLLDLKYALMSIVISYVVKVVSLVYASCRAGERLPLVYQDILSED